jgi:hypothetical protein
VTLDIHGVVKNATDDDPVVLGDLVEQKKGALVACLAPRAGSLRRDARPTHPVSLGHLDRR